jgi:formylglycine-generating enzyme required for sulfatase activity
MGNNPSSIKGDDFPIDTVSWEDAQNFIRKLNEMEGTAKYRLPSEAEWEYACRAGTMTKYCFGADKSKLEDYAWYVGNSKDKLYPVGQKKPNPWGLYDIHGNVYEWVQDRWHKNYNGAPCDGSAWTDGDSSDRVARGGGYRFGLYFESRCRSAYRQNHKSSSRDSSYGFRILRENSIEITSNDKGITSENAIKEVPEKIIETTPKIITESVPQVTAETAPKTVIQKETKKLQKQNRKGLH